MNNFYNLEYLSERLAAVCKERDELRQELNKLVLCRDCKHRGTDKCPMYYEETVAWINNELMPEWDVTKHDSTKDDGYCDRGERSETDV